MFCKKKNEEVKRKNDACFLENGLNRIAAIFAEDVFHNGDNCTKSRKTFNRMNDFIMGSAFLQKKKKIFAKIFDMYFHIIISG